MATTQSRYSTHHETTWTREVKTTGATIRMDARCPLETNSANAFPKAPITRDALRAPDDGAARREAGARARSAVPLPPELPWHNT